MRYQLRQLHSYLHADTRAVSTQVGYVLSIAIIAILMAGLISSTGELVTETTHQGIQTELHITGDRLAGQIMEVDRILAASGKSPSIILTANIPDQTSNGLFTLSYKNSSLVLKSTQSEVTVSIPLQTQHDVVVESPQAVEWQIYTDGDNIAIGAAEEIPR